MYIRGPKQLRIQKISAWFKIVIKLGSSLSKSAIPVVGSRVSEIEVFVANQCEVERAAAAKPLWMICPLEIVDLHDLLIPRETLPRWLAAIRSKSNDDISLL
jgi:hypothetical protein